MQPTKHLYMANRINEFVFVAYKYTNEFDYIVSEKKTFKVRRVNRHIAIEYAYTKMYAQGWKCVELLRSKYIG